MRLANLSDMGGFIFINKIYEIEREGQIDFFKDFRIDYKNNEVLIDNTDGVWNGNLFEFKLYIKDINKVLFQAIKYLSRMRVKGESVPSNILLISLNETKCYHFKSSDYFEEIHEIYTGASSKNNEAFISKDFVNVLDYSIVSDAVKLKNLLKETEYMPIDIDENCIVGWAERYYRENPKAKKGDFIGDEEGVVKIVGEIREPKHFKGLINPYTKKTNEKFKYLMDKLNDKLSKKDLGAFYTPRPYCEKSAELLRKAIARVPKGNDYVIIDRCAGTGNLESVLTDEELSHCILSTYEYYEYKVLNELIGDKVRLIIPPTESHAQYSNGYILNADALAREFIENELVKDYIDNPNCTVILYENPPYSESSTIETNKSDSTYKANWKNSYVMSEMKKEVKGRVTNELANLFIWSAFKYYLRQPTDSYILFSPIKYWKSQNIINKEFVDGFICNKKHFHASPSAVTCIYWQNVDSKQNEIDLNVFDIDAKSKIDSSNGCIVDLEKTITIKKVSKLLSEAYDKRKFDTDMADGIIAGTNGYEVFKKARIKPVSNENIIGYLISQSFSFENPRLMANLTTLPLYNGNGFYLRKDNYLEKLPLFVAGKYPIEDLWYENGILYKSFDGGDKYKKDKEFLKQCLIFTSLTYYNKCLSFEGSDGREYTNELCLDVDTVAYKNLSNMNLNKDEKELIRIWTRILDKSKKTRNYNQNYKYGVYQITQELNTSRKDENKKIVYDYPELNSDLESLKSMLKVYYKKYIIPNLLKYELIK